MLQYQDCFSVAPCGFCVVFLGVLVDRLPDQPDGQLHASASHLQNNISRQICCLNRYAGVSHHEYCWPTAISVGKIPRFFGKNFHDNWMFPGNLRTEAVELRVTGLAQANWWRLVEISSNSSGQSGVGEERAATGHMRSPAQVPGPARRETGREHHQPS